jgi:hypothetical protein
VLKRHVFPDECKNILMYFVKTRSGGIHFLEAKHRMLNRLQTKCVRSVIFTCSDTWKYFNEFLTILLISSFLLFSQLASDLFSRLIV